MRLACNIADSSLANDVYHADCRKGLYPISSFPQPLGTEAAGEIVGLPTEGKVLNDEEYKLRGFSLGGKVAVVSNAFP